MGNIPSVLKHDFGRGAAMPVPIQGSNHNFTVPYKGCRHALCLFPIGLLELRAIDIFEMDRFAAAVVANGQSIAFMDGDNPRDNFSP